MMIGAIVPASPVARSLVDIYTADDERLGLVETTTGNPKTRWTPRDLGGHLLRTWVDDATSGTHVWSWSEDEIWRGSSLLASESPTGTKHFGLDHLGSPAVVTKTGGVLAGTEAFDAFGGGGATSSDMLQYTGQERDAFNVDAVADLPDYFHARHYAVNSGRFMSVDPTLDLKKTLPNPQMWNRYAYVVNNPLRYTDPDGREHVNEPGFTKPLTEADWSDAPPVIKGAFYIEGGLLTMAAGGPLRSAAFEASLVLMRNPGMVLAAMKVLDALGGDGSSHINIPGPRNAAMGKLDYLLGNVANAESRGKGGFFAGVMGFSAKTLDAAIRSHFAENFAENGVLQANGRLAVTGQMTGANGVVATVKTVWQWVESTKTWDLITATPTY